VVVEVGVAEEVEVEVAEGKCLTKAYVASPMFTTLQVQQIFGF
jgi:hypothetical protein